MRDTVLFLCKHSNNTFKIITNWHICNPFVCFLRIECSTKVKELFLKNLSIVALTYASLPFIGLSLFPNACFLDPHCHNSFISYSQLTLNDSFKYGLLLIQSSLILEISKSTFAIMDSPTFRKASILKTLNASWERFLLSS